MDPVQDALPDRVHRFRFDFDQGPELRLQVALDLRALENVNFRGPGRVGHVKAHVPAERVERDAHVHVHEPDVRHEDNSPRGDRQLRAVVEAELDAVVLSRRDERDAVDGRGQRVPQGEVFQRERLHGAHVARDACERAPDLEFELMKAHERGEHDPEEGVHPLERDRRAEFHGRRFLGCCHSLVRFLVQGLTGKVDDAEKEDRYSCYGAQGEEWDRENQEHTKFYMLVSNLNVHCVRL